MAESISRSLRGGALEGEHAPALTVKDSLGCPLGPHVFHHFLCSLAAHVAAGTSQARGLVILAFSRSPDFYLDLLKRRGLDASLLDNLVSVLDCYSDPLGWKHQLSRLGGTEKSSEKKSKKTVVRDVRDVNKLLSLTLDLGKGLIGQGKLRFAVAIDSVSTMLRHALLPSVAGLLSNLRSHDQISCIFWLIHPDLHETRACLSLEYISTMVASLESIGQPIDGQKRGSENLTMLEQNSHRGKLYARLKRRNGRVKLHYEEFHVEQVGIKFTAVSSENTTINQSLLPKVQFNLQLSEKERVDRAKVVLPFEHQGNGEMIQIYDGRQSLLEGQKDPYLLRPSSSTLATAESTCGRGEIHYFRDSDDERPDSDEDPDDDLDI